MWINRTALPIFVRRCTSQKQPYIAMCIWARSVLYSGIVAIGVMTTNVILRSTWMEIRRYRQYLEEERNSFDPHCWSLFSQGKTFQGYGMLLSGELSWLANPG